MSDYQRGYRAGLKRKRRQVTAEQTARRHDAFWQRAYLAALPAILEGKDWTMDGKEVTKLNDRIELAARAADESLRKAIGRMRV